MVTVTNLRIGPFRFGTLPRWENSELSAGVRLIDWPHETSGSFRLYEKYPDEFVATARKSGQPVAHTPSLRRLYAVLKRKRIDPTQTIVEKTPPKDTAVIY